MAQRFVFDAAGIEALEAGEREWRAWDEALPGFGVRIRPSGTKSWIVRARTRGANGKVRRQRVTIGRCDEVSLEEARAEARRLLGADAGAGAVEALPAAGMDDERASRGRDGSLGGPAPGVVSGGDAAAVSAAEDDGNRPKAGAAVGRGACGLPRAPESTGASGRGLGGDDRPGADTVADLAERLDSARGGLDRIEALMAKIGPQLEELAGAVPFIARDRRRGRRRRAGTVLAALLVGAAALASGVYVQSRDPILPQADPTRGWKDHVWEHYGESFMECFDRARKEPSGRAKCTIGVRAR